MQNRLTFDEAQHYIISGLKVAEQNSKLHTSQFSSNVYDLHHETVVNLYINKGRSPSINPFQSHQERNAEAIRRKHIQRMFADVLFDFCNKGILRPGPTFIGDFSTLGVNTLNEGFSLTEFGIAWLSRIDEHDLIPSSTDKLSQLFDSFQPLFGKNYFKRIKEAVNCYQTGNYLACCVMCGAATESILLSVAFKMNDETVVLKEYFSSRGRSKIENMLFNKAPDHIRKIYPQFTGLIAYWRDETGHGHDSDVDNNEAFVALIAVVRFANFIKQHLCEITNQNL